MDRWDWNKWKGVLEDKVGVNEAMRRTRINEGQKWNGVIRYVRGSEEDT